MVFQCSSLFFFFAPIHKLSHITECRSLLLPLLPPSLTADLCREERGDWQFPPTEQRQEARPGPRDLRAGNMMTEHFSLTSQFDKDVRYDGGILRSVLPNTSPRLHPSKKRQRISSLSGRRATSPEFFRATFLVAQLDFCVFFFHTQQQKCSIMLTRKSVQEVWLPH